MWSGTLGLVFSVQGEYLIGKLYDTEEVTLVTKRYRLCVGDVCSTSLGKQTEMKGFKRGRPYFTPRNQCPLAWQTN